MSSGDLNLALKLVYFPSKPPSSLAKVWQEPALLAGAALRAGIAGLWEGSGLMLHRVCGLGARWDVVSPKIARSCGALSKRCDFPSCAWPRAGSLPQDLLLKLAAFAHAVCPVSVISSCLRRWRDQNHSLKKHQILRTHF